MMATSLFDHLCECFGSYLKRDLRNCDHVLPGAQDRVEALLAKDYHIALLDNSASQFCHSYPLRLVVIERERGVAEGAPKINDASTLGPAMMRSRWNRAHGRFVAPVLVFRGRNVCRSATLSVQAESLFNTVHAKTTELIGSWYDSDTEAEGDQSSSPLMLSLDGRRRSDVKLLAELRVKHICDLMVEHRKTMYGLTLTSSEKVDMYYDSDQFDINLMPYPGCEFFREYRDNGMDAAGLVYDWNQSVVTVVPNLNTDYFRQSIHTDWHNYTEWDIATMTGHYLRFILDLLEDKSLESGILVHCISGWDRTPLFISLIRLSLWADGLVHKSLDPVEMLYLTLAYDWMLFRHQLRLRRSKGEEIMYFCFDFLEKLADPRFSLCETPGGEETEIKLEKEKEPESHTLMTEQSTTTFNPIAGTIFSSINPTYCLDPKPSHRMNQHCESNGSFLLSPASVTPCKRKDSASNSQQPFDLTRKESSLKPSDSEPHSINSTDSPRKTPVMSNSTAEILSGDVHCMLPDQMSQKPHTKNIVTPILPVSPADINGHSFQDSLTNIAAHASKISNDCSPMSQNSQLKPDEHSSINRPDGITTTVPQDSPSKIAKPVSRDSAVGLASPMSRHVTPDNTVIQVSRHSQPDTTIQSSRHSQPDTDIQPSRHSQLDGAIQVSHNSLPDTIIQVSRHSQPDADIPTSRDPLLSGLARPASLRCISVPETADERRARIGKSAPIVIPDSAPAHREAGGRGRAVLVGSTRSSSRGSSGAIATGSWQLISDMAASAESISPQQNSLSSTRGHSLPSSPSAKNRLSPSLSGQGQAHDRPAQSKAQNLHNLSPCMSRHHPVGGNLKHTVGSPDLPLGSVGSEGGRSTSATRSQCSGSPTTTWIDDYMGNDSVSLNGSAVLSGHTDSPTLRRVASSPSRQSFRQSVSPELCMFSLDEENEHSMESPKRVPEPKRTVTEQRRERVRRLMKVRALFMTKLWPDCVNASQKATTDKCHSDSTRGSSTATPTHANSGVACGVDERVSSTSLFARWIPGVSGQ
eukprot:908203_1